MPETSGRAHNLAEVLHALGHDGGIGGARQITGTGRDFRHANADGSLRDSQVVQAFGHFDCARDFGHRPGDFHRLAGLR